MTNLMDTSTSDNKQNLSAPNCQLKQHKMPFNQHDQNSQELPPAKPVPLKEKIHKQNVTKFTTDKETEDFVKRLVEFHRHRFVNTPLSQWPTLNGKAVDLYKLYMKVYSLGGWERVCEKCKWEEIWKDLNFTSSNDMKACFNGSHAIKLIYIRYLSLYEKFEAYWSSLNEQSTSQSLTSMLNNSASFFIAHNKLSADPERLNAADESTLGIVNRRRFSYLFEAVPMNYNTNQHAISSYTVLSDVNDPTSDQTSESQHQLTRLVYNPYEKLEQSLISGLPNEIDFVFNTIMLLSGDEFHCFRIYQSPRLVDLMLAHIGFFGPGKNSSLNYREMYDNVWNFQSQEMADQRQGFNFGTACPESNKLRRRNYVKFWHNAVRLPEDINQSLISKLMPKLYNKYLASLPDQDLFNLRDDTIHKIPTVEYRRIEQVMITLNNLSFEDHNADFMANRCPVLFEFLVMCLFCNGEECYVELKKHALDILTNISRKIKLNKMSETHRCLLLVSLDYLINGPAGQRCLANPYFEGHSTTTNGNSPEQSNDQFDIIRGLEVLTKLCSQKIDPNNDSDDYINEQILSTSEVVAFKETVDMQEHVNYKINTLDLVDSFESALNSQTIFLNKILYRLEHLLPLQDIFVLLHSLECLYSMSQFSSNICDLIVSYKSSSNSESKPKIVSMLINLLSIDMTHFGMFTNHKQQTTNVPMKVYKIVPTSNIIAQPVVSQSQASSATSNLHINSTKPVHNASLLQQTLHNQHNTNTVASNSPKIISSLQQASQNINQANTVNSNNTVRPVSSQEKTAKSVLCNWLRTCFQMDGTSEISKTKLYPYYQQIAKINNWSVLTIPTFFEILNATFPNLRYNDSQITGLKLVVNIKQQLQMKKDDLIKESTDTWTSQAANVKCTTKPASAASPSKTSSSNQLNATKIKYLLNPSSFSQQPQQQNQQQQQQQQITQTKTIVSQSPINGHIEPPKEPTPPLTIISDLPTEISVSAAPFVPILTPPNSLVAQSDFEMKEPESNVKEPEFKTKEESSLVGQLDAAVLGLKHQVEKTETEPPTNSVNIELKEFSSNNNQESSDKRKLPESSVTEHALDQKNENCKKVCTDADMQDKLKNEAVIQTTPINQQRIIVPVPSVNTNTSNLIPKDAALLAIQRHQKKSMDEFWNVNDEGPLTKSIRLLAALTLRNLSRNSEKGKKSIQPYASTLATIAFDMMESSNTIANCLWYLTH